MNTELTQSQKQAMRDDGFVVFPGLLSPELVADALRAINHSVGEGINPADMPKLRAQSFCPEVKPLPAITNLFNASPAKGLAEGFLGKGMLKPVTAGQIALRFPRAEPAHAAPLPELRPHIDGMYSPTNGVKEGTIGNFTALCGCFLSDVPSEWAGNFTVWPGTHRQHAAYFREHGPQSLLNGMPTIDRPAARQIVARAGDVVLAHYLLGHGVAINTAPQVRYAIFFRLKSLDHDRESWESMTDEWRHWPGMRGVV